VWKAAEHVDGYVFNQVRTQLIMARHVQQCRELQRIAEYVGGCVLSLAGSSRDSRLKMRL